MRLHNILLVLSPVNEVIAYTSTLCTGEQQAAFRHYY